MPEQTQAFKWIGINSQGKRVDGVVKAADMKDAMSELKKMNIEVIKLDQNSQIAAFSFSKYSRKNKIKPEDIVLFTRFLSTMISAGLPIVQAMDIISRDQDNVAMRSLVVNLKSNISGGKTLAESFHQYPEQFNELYCSLIKAGEKSGTIDKILKRLGNYLERTESLKRKIKKALVYPAAILVVALVVSLILLIFVVPQFEAMFKSFGADLPAFTRMVVNLSLFIRSYWWLLLLGAGIGIISFRRALNENEKVKAWIDKWVLKLYIIGPILKKGIIARFTRTLATTLEAGMPIVESMKSMENVMGNKIYADAVRRIREEVTTGHQLSASMEATKLFPNMTIQMIAVGEASGAMADMLNKVSDYYEDDVNTMVDNLSSLIEPIIMAVLGVIVGSFVVAMYLPIFRIGSLF